MKIPDHSHEYLIPVATKEEIREGTSQDSVVVPKVLGTASLYSYETFAPLEQVVNVRQESEKAMARANSAQQIAEESKRVSDQALTEVTKTGEAVTAATTTANLAKDTADTAKGLAEEAKSASDAAKQMAEEAKTGVEQASQTASEAKGLAETAKSAAGSVTEKVDQALREASDAKSKAEGLETIANEAKSTSDQASQTALSAKSLSEEAQQEASRAKSIAEEAKKVCEAAQAKTDKVEPLVVEAKEAAETAKTTAEEAKSALTEVQEKAQSSSDNLSELQGKVGSLYTYFLEDVRFDQPYRILEADPQNRKGLVINEGACFRFYHGGENGDRYLFYRVPGRGRMSFEEDLEAGKDYYIYLILKDQTNEISYEILQNPTAPDGYTEDNSEKIGGFHTLCADVGEIEGHPLSGYRAGDILPNSVWCLNHRPHSSPEGMVYDPSTDLWVDIYLQSGTGENTRSAYNVPITTNRLQTDHISDMLRVKKALLNNTEFTSAMYGSNEGGGIQGKKAPSPKHSGGHKNTQNRRMISHIGCEDGCGYVWQFVRDVCFMQTVTGTSPNVQLKKDMYALLAGGDWLDTTNITPHLRAVIIRNAIYESASARGCSHPRHFV
ncbi:MULTISPECIES: alanine-zipper protein [unclassified Bartonella]|uniref:phage major tropism determinant n=1 Tax=unclassified Bartonella TaxID=2645622 RepID=UPI0035CEC05F